MKGLLQRTGLGIHDGHVAFAVDALVIAIVPPELCTIYGHRWPSPFLFGATVL